MTRRFAFLAILLAIALAVPALAHAQKPNFSGKWVQDMDKSDPAPAGRQGGGGGTGGGGGRGPAGPATLTYTMTAAELTIEREGPNGVTKTVYKLDGSPSSNAGGRGGDVVSKTVWEGNTLVTTYERTMGETTMKVKEVRTMDGDNLVVTTTNSGGPNGDTTRKIVFNKG
jgi:hypothetical protein